MRLPPTIDSRYVSALSLAVILTKNLDARLADLGLATQIEEVGTAAAATTRSHGGGTRGYQAPEVATKKFTTKADMYSLCQMYFEMAVGKRPVLEDGVRITPGTLGPLEAKDDKATLSLMQFMLKVDSAERPTAAEAVSRIKLILSRINLIERGIHVDYQAEQHVVAEQDVMNSKSMSAFEWISQRISAAGPPQPSPTVPSGSASLAGGAAFPAISSPRGNSRNFCSVHFPPVLLTSQPPCHIAGSGTPSGPAEAKNTLLPLRGLIDSAWLPARHCASHSANSEALKQPRSGGANRIRSPA